MQAEAFLDLVKKDRRKAGQWLISEMGGRIRRLAGQWLDRDVEDAVQEVFREVFQSLPRFKGKAAPTTWCYRIAMNTLLDYRRRQGRTAALEPMDETAPDLRPETVARFQDTPFTLLGKKELRTRVREALESLDEIHRTVLKLRSFENLRYGEIAEVLGVPVGTVKSRMAAASARLAEKLQAYMEA